MGTIIRRFMLLWIGIFVTVFVVTIVINRQEILMAVKSSMGGFIGGLAVILITLAGLWLLVRRFRRW